MSMKSISYPTVVMEIKDHQNPSPTPLVKVRGNSSELLLESFKKVKYSRVEIKQGYT